MKYRYPKLRFPFFVTFGCCILCFCMLYKLQWYRSPLISLGDNYISYVAEDNTSGDSKSHISNEVYDVFSQSLSFTSMLPLSPSNYITGLNKEQTKSFRIDNLINVISNLTKIRRDDRLMQEVRNNLEQLNDVPHVSADIIKKSESSSWTTVIPPVARVVYQDTWHGYTYPVLTVKPTGRLGNKMGEYATLFALRRHYNVSALLDHDMKKQLSLMFSNLSLPVIPGNFISEEWEGVGTYKTLYNYSPIELAASGLLGPKKFLIGGFAFEIQLFHNFRKELKKEFTFNYYIRNTVEKFFRNVQERRKKIGHTDIVYVGFHVRRTDYKDHMEKVFGATLPEDRYFNRAMDYYRNKFPTKVLFIAASDDYNFIKSKIGHHKDVMFSPGTSAQLDLAILSSCNHSIITLGSYGFWSAFLAGGEVVYPDKKFDKLYRFSREMYEMIGLKSFTPLPAD